MKPLIRRAILALTLIAGITPAFAQAPAPVPALPDTERRTSYTISATTCACAVNFALYGDSTDYQNWVEVWLNGVRVNFNDATFGWTITSPSGPLSSIARPVTNAILTFNSAQTGTVQIVGARRPRRTILFQENRGVAARDLNQGINDITAVLREMWDKTNDVTGRSLLGLPGETLSLLPSASARAGGYLCWDGTGLIPLACAPLNGQGNVVGPNSAVDSHFAVYNGITGRIIKDGGAVAPIANSGSASDLSSGSVALARGGLGGTQAAATANQIPVFPGSAGAAIPTSATTWFDNVYCNTVGYVIVRLTSVWTCSNSYPRNIVWFGGDPTGVAATDTPFTNAYASLSNIGGAIYFPTGNYSFTSAVSKTLPNAQFAITLKGDGANASTLQWPNASGGITLTASNTKNTFHIRDLTFMTSQVGSGTAIHVVGVGANSGQQFQSDIHDVSISGDDIGPTAPTLHYWATGILLHNWGSIDIDGVNTWGPHQAPSAAGGGTGLLFEGNAGTSSFATILNVARSSFNYHVLGMQLGDAWQGVTIDQTNFNGQVGGSCLVQSSGATLTLVLLTVTNSQFNCGTNGILFSSAVLNPTFIGNTISITGNGNSGINTGTGGSGLIAIGNVINQTGAFTGTFCIAYAGAGGVILGNMFSQCATPVNLQAASSNTGVSQNRYASGASSASNINAGTGNNVGTATP